MLTDPSGSSPTLPASTDRAEILRAGPGATIRVLPQELTARIAAGEVIERPASVLKELVENALDAGASRIHVEIAGGGRDLLRVSDDGRGMSPSDLALCILPHATSKLGSADDLVTLTTLGFRGEALPSIASVSRFSIVTRTREARDPGSGTRDPGDVRSASGNGNAFREPLAGSREPIEDTDAPSFRPGSRIPDPGSRKATPLPEAPPASIGSRLPAPGSRQAGPHGSDIAWRIEMSGGKPDRPEPVPAAGPFGTTVEVKELFFNLPARAKFLKGQASEAAACVDTLLRLALTRPDVAFSMKQERSEIVALPALANVSIARNACQAAPDLPLAAYHRRAREILGRENSRGLVELAIQGPSDPSIGNDGAPPGYRLFGLVSPPAHTRPNRSQIYLTVNGRPVKDRTLTSALLESYRHLLPPKRYPIAVVFLELPGEDVDINVHPTKAEVRFRLPGLVYALFHSAIRAACGVKDLPPISPATPGAPEPSKYVPETPLLRGVGDRVAEDAPRNGWLARGAAAFRDPGSGTRDPGDIGSASGNGDAFREPGAGSREPMDVGNASDRHEALQTSPGSRIPDPGSRKVSPEVWPTSIGSRPPAPGSRTIDPEAPPFRVLGQAGGAYIVLEEDSGLKLIDQHALHERVLFEVLLARAHGRARGDAQGLLIPETLELTPVQMALYLQDASAQEVLANLGFDVEQFGPNAVAVRSVPSILKHASASALVRDVLDALAQSDEPGAKKSTERGALREKAAYILSCKGALKAGERLTIEQMTALVAEFRRHVGSGAFTCPHGRPLALEVSWNDLDRAVGRK